MPVSWKDLLPIQDCYSGFWNKLHKEHNPYLLYKVTDKNRGGGSSTSSLQFDSLCSPLHEQPVRVPKAGAVSCFQEGFQTSCYMTHSRDLPLSGAPFPEKHILVLGILKHRIPDKHSSGDSAVSSDPTAQGSSLPGSSWGLPGLVQISKHHLSENYP